MESAKTNYFDIKILLGVFIIVVGLIALLNNIGLDTGIDYWDFWPMILIIIGIGKLLQPRQYRNVLGGSIILAIGVLFQLGTLDIIDLAFRHLWPFILILIGLAIFRHGYRRGFTPGTIDSNRINFAAIIGGGEYNYNSQILIGGSATSILGGGTINLTQAEMENETLVIDTFSLMGGVEIIVPKHWDVVIQGTPVMGGMSDKTVHPAATQSGENQAQTRKRLIVKGIAIMGGVEIKN